VNRTFLFGGLAILVIAAIIGAYMFFQLPEPEAPVASDPAGEGATAAANAAPPVIAPSFDVVRVDENGNVVIAGRASPGCTIVVRDGDLEVGRATADRSGEWVLVPDDSLPAGERQFTLFAECDGADPVQAERVIALVVPERKGPVVAVAVPRDGEGKAEVLQRPSLDTSAAAVGAIDYDDDGNTTLSGVAEPNSTVRVYLNNKLVGTTQADGSGRWSLTLDSKVTTGTYTLRVDQVDAAGKVVARSEIPFVRAEPLRELPDGRVVIIQPGDHLWRIATQRYGSGFQYTLIYDANKDQIRNPDLIYPGQVFTLPTAN
jgi:nucleoid-associated protein YgaU